MKQNKTNLLVQLNVGDLQQLIMDAVKKELDNLKNLIQMDPKDSEKHNSDIISRKEVCEILQVSLPTLHNWNKSGILKNSRIGRRVYYLKSEVLEKLNSAA